MLLILVLMTTCVCRDILVLFSSLMLLEFFEVSVYVFHRKFEITFVIITFFFMIYVEATLIRNRTGIKIMYTEHYGEKIGARLYNG